MQQYHDASMVDIHCHLLHGLDDGADSLEKSLTMAKLAVADGIDTIIVTPHQNGTYAGNAGDMIRQRTEQLQTTLAQQGLPLSVLPGADVRIEEGLVAKIQTGEIVTLGDHHKHVLLELPHELYFPLEPVLESLQGIGVTGILSHPERNRGLLRRRSVIRQLVDRGCLMQITAGSLLGQFGPDCQECCHWMLSQGVVHFVATDAHGIKRRPPLLREARACVGELTCEFTAHELFQVFPGCVARGCSVPTGRRVVKRPRSVGWRPWQRWLGRKKAG